MKGLRRFRLQATPLFLFLALTLAAFPHPSGASSSNGIFPSTHEVKQDIALFNKGVSWAQIACKDGECLNLGIAGPDEWLTDIYHGNIVAIAGNLNTLGGYKSFGLILGLIVGSREHALFKHFYVDGTYTSSGANNSRVRVIISAHDKKVIFVVAKPFKWQKMGLIIKEVERGI